MLETCDESSEIKMLGSWSTNEIEVEFWGAFLRSAWAMPPNAGSECLEASGETEFLVGRLVLYRLGQTGILTIFIYVNVRDCICCGGCIVIQALACRNAH